ncbi:hypothetical protein B0H17DRAFT_1206230 [Mycena rosella]|uniref:Uncharacterized protein n=1 Tax=Mycena rosella TaxID=1033263 RepID=A0AAD7D5T1_MYCRO|nr:hypothetical protein B0H17DRAFT_1206230 [Mycena rosella]
MAPWRTSEIRRHDNDSVFPECASETIFAIILAVRATLGIEFDSDGLPSGISPRFLAIKLLEIRAIALRSRLVGSNFLWLDLRSLDQYLGTATWSVGDPAGAGRVRRGIFQIRIRTRDIGLYWRTLGGCTEAKVRAAGSRRHRIAIKPPADPIILPPLLLRTPALISTARPKFKDRIDDALHHLAGPFQRRGYADVSPWIRWAASPTQRSSTAALADRSLPAAPLIEALSSAAPQPAAFSLHTHPRNHALRLPGLCMLRFGEPGTFYGSGACAGDGSMTIQQTRAILRPCLAACASCPLRGRNLRSLAPPADRAQALAVLFCQRVPVDVRLFTAPVGEASSERKQVFAVSLPLPVFSYFVRAGCNCHGKTLRSCTVTQHACGASYADVVAPAVRAIPVPLRVTYGSLLTHSRAYRRILVNALGAGFYGCV